MMDNRQRLKTMKRVNLLILHFDDEEFKKSGITPVP